MFVVPPDFYRWRVLILCIATKMLNPFCWHWKLLFQKNDFRLLKEIGDYRKPLHETSSFIESKYLSLSHFFDSVENWRFSCFGTKKIKDSSWDWELRTNVILMSAYKCYRKYNMVLKSSNLEMELLQKNCFNNFLCQRNVLNIFVTIEEIKS